MSTDDSPTSELKIPQSTWWRATSVRVNEYGEAAPSEDDLRRIAAPVVAAELRRIAAELDEMGDRLDRADRRTPGLGSAALLIGRRADELDGGA